MGSMNVNYTLTLHPQSPQNELVLNSTLLQILIVCSEVAAHPWELLVIMPLGLCKVPTHPLGLCDRFSILFRQGNSGPMIRQLVTH